MRSPPEPMEASDQTPDAPTPPPEVEQAVMLGHLEEAVGLYVTHTGVDEETARAVVEKLASELGLAPCPAPPMRRSTQRRADRIGQAVGDDRGQDHEGGDVEDRRRNAHVRLRTNSANSIEATPLGPNQAMNAFWGPGSRLRTKEIMMASGRTTSSARQQ